MAEATSAQKVPVTSSEHAVRVGRGALLIAAGKGWFLVTGAVVNFALASLLSEQGYADYGVTIRWVSLLNMMVVMGLMQGMSRAVAREPQAAGTLYRQAFPTVAAVAILAAGIVMGLAAPLAGLLGDAHLT